MPSRHRRFTTRARRWMLIALFSAILPTTRLARADLIFAIEPVTLTGNTSGGFDVILTNTGPDVTIGGFAFELTTNSSGVHFTAVDASTASIAYIFQTDSLFGGAIDNTPAPGLPGTLVAASDLSTQVLLDPPSGYWLAQGGSIGLGRVDYTADSTAAGPLLASFDFPATNLSDPYGNVIPLSGVVTVPEPHPLLMIGEVALVASGVLAWWLRRAGRIRVRAV